MTYLLDSDHISILLRRTGPEHDVLRQRMDQHDDFEFGLSVVSFHEQMMGCNAYIARNRPIEVLRGYNLVGSLLDQYCPAHIVPIDDTARSEFDALRSHGIRIATMDLRIAAIAMVNGLVLLTRNTVDFSKVPGLTYEDWTTP